MGWSATGLPHDSSWLAVWIHGLLVEAAAVELVRRYWWGHDHHYSDLAIASRVSLGVVRLDKWVTTRRKRRSCPHLQWLLV